MIFNPKIIQISDFIDRNFPSFANLPSFSKYKSFNDKIIVLEGVGLSPEKGMMSEKEMDICFEKIKNYEVIIFSDSEHIWIDNWIYFLKLLVDNKKIIIMSTFTIGLKNYINKILPNNFVYFNSIENLIGKNSTDILFDTDPDFSKNRNYLLKFFSYNRSPQRDYVFDFLIKNNLINGNNLSFHNYPFIELKDKLNLKKSNTAYYSNEADELLKNVDLKQLNNLRLIPQSESFNVQTQNIQHDKNVLASKNSYFEIISEAQMPYSIDSTNSFYYTHSITKRTIIPILTGNVFHIMPTAKAFEEDLKEIGFKLFFENDSDFLNKLNEDFYFEKNTQDILKQNFDTIYSIQKNYNENKNFIIDILNEIYP